MINLSTIPRMTLLKSMWGSQMPLMWIRPRQITSTWKSSPKICITCQGLLHFDILVGHPQDDVVEANFHNFDDFSAFFEYFFSNLYYNQNETPYFIGLIQFLTDSFMHKIQILLLHEKAQANFLQVVFSAILKLWGGCAPPFLTPPPQKKNLYYILR